MNRSLQLESRIRDCFLVSYPLLESDEKHWKKKMNFVLDLIASTIGRLQDKKTKKRKEEKKNKTKQKGVILLLIPEFSRLFPSCANESFFYQIWIWKKKKELNSGLSSKNRRHLAYRLLLRIFIIYNDLTFYLPASIMWKP